MWIARDRNRRLKLWQVKPRRGTYHWHAIDKNQDSYYSMILDNESAIFQTYKFIGWEDEPLEVELFRYQEPIDEKIIQKLGNHYLEIIREPDDESSKVSFTTGYRMGWAHITEFVDYMKAKEG